MPDASRARAFSTAILQLATRSICPAPAPQSCRSAAMHTALLLRCFTTAIAKAASARVAAVGSGPAATRRSEARTLSVSRSCASMPPGTERNDIGLSLVCRTSPQASSLTLRERAAISATASSLKRGATITSRNRFSSASASARLASTADEQATIPPYAASGSPA